MKIIGEFARLSQRSERRPNDQDAVGAALGSFRRWRGSWQIAPIVSQSTSGAVGCEARGDGTRGLIVMMSFQGRGTRGTRGSLSNAV